MAEGIDEAASAFQTQIAPQAPERPRDQGGRFTGRPESMFEPRPVEGDELTGDTRDGGDDARLAAAERRIADGRAEEGDEQSLQDGARARNAGRDARHANDNSRAANDNAERLGPQELEDQDADGPDGGAEGEQGDAEGQPEQDAEGPKYEVTVDGQTMEVPLAEALKGYIREATFKQRMNKVHEARQAVEQEAATTVQARDYYAQKLAMLERTLGELTPPPPNWDQEFAQDPRAAHEKQKAYASIYNKIAWAQQEQQRTAQEAAQEYDRNSARYAVEQFTQFVQEAKIPDEKALTGEMSSMRSYAKMRGFSEGEIATVYDKRMLAVLRDAAKYHQSTSAQPKPVVPGRGKTLTPGSATPLGNAGRRNIDDAQRKLAQTGRLDDAAALFQRLIR
jgi:hypothetical protein